jgi:hypothetical protein
MESVAFDDHRAGHSLTTKDFFKSSSHRAGASTRRAGDDNYGVLFGQASDPCALRSGYSLTGFADQGAAEGAASEYRIGSLTTGRLGAPTRGGGELCGVSAELQVRRSISFSDSAF